MAVKKKVVKPPHRKRRDVNLLQGDAGEKLVASAMPEQWLVRKLDQDFGIDLHVEAFEWAKDDPTAADTLGEHFFVQVKSQAKLKTVFKALPTRKNVAKYPLAKSTEPGIEEEVVACVLEVGELMTIEAMGSATPVILCVAAMESKTVYYLCLNDYISKVLLPTNPNYTAQQHVTVHVPMRNVLDRDDPSIAYLWLLARRSKFYSAFNTFSYQAHELAIAADQVLAFVDMLGSDQADPPLQILNMLEVFLSGNLRLDIWHPAGPGQWPPLDDVRESFELLASELPSLRRPMSGDQLMQLSMRLVGTFDRAANLGRMYEEIAREWRLPTELAVMLDR